MTYLYECKECGNKFEEIKKVDERYDMVCPECEGEVRIVISNTTFKQFKEYVDWHTTRTPVKITSRTQRKEHLKKNQCYEN